ncbi:MAG: C4-dicarboxylate ABC transporter substrate-binding protein, partial [Rhizobium sp.]|nr:C4-dicarboxylate ABC transporter substrate-binding protein [Rhizobium sp.]
PDIPQAFSKGVVDGALIPWEIIPALKLQDQTEYQIEGVNKTRLGTTTFQVSMNLDKWNSLPEDIQKAFLDNSGEEWVKKAADIWRQIDENGIKVATDAGNKHIQLTQEETDAFKTVLEPVVDRWVKEVDGKGIDGAALVAKARELVAANTGK